MTTTTFDTRLHPRTPAGVRSGGQFATRPNAEADLQLAPTALDVRIDEGFPVPQANNLDAIASVPDAVAAGADTPKGIAAALGMSDREGDYYGNAAGYLGLVELEPHAPVRTFRLTDAGRVLAETPDPAARAQLMAAIVDEVPAVQDLRDGDEQGVIDRLAGDRDLSGTTITRRLDSFRSWDRQTASPIELADQVALVADGVRTNIGAAIQVSRSERDAAKAHRREAAPALCGSCFMQLPSSGLCDSCD